MTRTHFHSSRLARLLADLVGMDALAAHQAFADKLGQWIAVSGAIALRATHTSRVGGAPDTTAALSHIGERFARARSALEHSLGDPDTPQDHRTTARGQARQGMPWPEKNAPLELAGAYAPYHRYYLTQQRQMDLKTKPLRAEVRTVVGSASGALGQLAAMDATLETLLAERENLLLARIPVLLEARFKHLRAAHQDALLLAQQQDHMALWTQPGGWLARFCAELHSVLHAELDLRLQPTVGLLEALHTATRTTR